MMAINTEIYYNPNDPGLLITSNIEKFNKNMELGIFPKTNYEKVLIANIDQYLVKDIAFNEVDNVYFQKIKGIISKYKLGVIAFHETTIDLSDVELNVEHLIIGDKSKIDLSSKNFINLKEITFLSVKTFKGKILDAFDTVKKLVLWYENKKSNDILLHFNHLKDFHIYNGSIQELDLTNNVEIEKLELHRCLKLEKVLLKSGQHLEHVTVEASNKLDTTNLGGFDPFY